jgi:heme exporter protein B
VSVAFSRFAVGELKRSFVIAFRRRGDLLQPLAFYAMVASLFPLAVNPEPALLVRVAAGVVWIGALLSTLLSLEHLFRRDFEQGTLEQLVLGGQPLFLAALVRVLGHWLLTGMLLTLLAPLLAGMLRLPVEALPILLLSLLLGTPILSMIGSVAAALTVGVGRGGLLVSLLVLPLYVPPLVLGVSAVELHLNGLSPFPPLIWLTAMLVGTLTLTPFATAAALRIGVDQ